MLKLVNYGRLRTIVRTSVRHPWNMRYVNYGHEEELSH